MPLAGSKLLSPSKSTDDGGGCDIARGLLSLDPLLSPPKKTMLSPLREDKTLRPYKIGGRSNSTEKMPITPEEEGGNPEETMGKE